jgi:hypothetical protein
MLLVRGRHNLRFGGFLDRQLVGGSFGQAALLVQGLYTPTTVAQVTARGGDQEILSSIL